MKTKTAAELDQDIRAYLAQPEETSEVTFHDLVQHDDPGAMTAAEDFLRRRGWKLREMTGGLQARHFTIALRPLYGPPDEWKMVQVTAEPAELSKVRDRYVRRGPGWVRVKMAVANGPVRVTREREFQGDLDEARKAAVASGWELAKDLKKLSMGAPQALVEKIVDEHFARRSKSSPSADFV